MCARLLQAKCLCHVVDDGIICIGFYPERLSALTLSKAEVDFHLGLVFDLQKLASSLRAPWSPMHPHSIRSWMSKQAYAEKSGRLFWFIFSLPALGFR